jgi:hypothetical protein
MINVHEAMWVQHNPETEYHQVVIMNKECTNYINKATDSNEKSPCRPSLIEQHILVIHALSTGLPGMMAVGDKKLL